MTLEAIAFGLLVFFGIQLFRNRAPSKTERRAEFMREYVLTCAQDGEYVPATGMVWADAAAADARAAWDAIEREAGKP